jgi:hypothetical protein
VNLEEIAERRDSPFHIVRIGAYLNRMNDREPVVPNQKTNAADLRRGANKAKLDECVSDSLPTDQYVIERWKNIEKNARGITGPLSLIKLVDICKWNKDCKLNKLYYLFYKRELYDLAYSQIKKA